MRWELRAAQGAQELGMLASGISPLCVASPFSQWPPARLRCCASLQPQKAIWLSLNCILCQAADALLPCSGCCPGCMVPFPSGLCTPSERGFVQCSLLWLRPLGLRHCQRQQAWHSLCIKDCPNPPQNQFVFSLLTAIQCATYGYPHSLGQQTEAQKDECPRIYEPRLEPGCIT